MNLFSEPSLEDLCAVPAARSSAPSLAPSHSFDVDVYDVSLTECPHPAVRSRPSAAQKAGLRYERKAKAYLASLYPGFVSGPWLSYRRMADHQKRFCQPDGYVFEADSGLLTIFEIKLRWCAEAANQLRLYRACLASLLHPRSVRCACVTRSFDPAVNFEGRAVLVDGSTWISEDASVIQVLIWK
jgi:hypothetical protein